MTMGMQKDYWEWHRVKSKLQQRRVMRSTFKVQEVWFIACGLNIGSEQDGKGNIFSRPVLILKKFNHHTFWGIPLSRGKKPTKLPYHDFEFKGKPTSWANISQLRLFDSKRLLGFFGKLRKSDFLTIKEKARLALEL